MSATLRVLLSTMTMAVAMATTNAPDDCETTTLSSSRISLSCHLSAINSEMEKTNFSVIPADSTIGLSVHCTNLHTPSTLESLGFASLRNLEWLIIDGCQLQRLPKAAFGGLGRLRRLVVRGPGPVAVDAAAFDGLDNLHELDIGNLGVSRLPDALCRHLPELRMINVSDNALTRIDALRSCRQLRVLDASKNELMEVDEVLETTLDLEEAYLASNHLVDVINVGEKLKVLDLENNRLTGFNAVKVTNSSLVSLDLSHNNIVASNLSLMSNLETLDLSHNNLAELNDNVFTKLPQLRNLDLSHNELMELPSELLTQNLMLQELKLDNNKLALLPSSLLSSSSSLQSLSLSHNRLATLPSSLFSRSTKLRQLHMSDNLLSEFHLDTFVNCSVLSVLDLSSNRFEHVATALKELHHLQTLDMSFNSIASLDSTSALSSMKHLWRLQLSHNDLDTVSKVFMERLEALQVLDLSHNALKALDKSLFLKNRVLQAVRLDGNALTEFDGIFDTLEQLRWLNISDNQIEKFDYAFLPKSLVWLDASHNLIDELANYDDLIGDTIHQLDVLDVGFNKIRSLGPNNVPDSVQTLLANDNSIEHIGAYTFFKKERLIKVDLTVNNLKRIDNNALRIAEGIKPTFLLGGNPVQCDCHMGWLKHINDNNEDNNDLMTFSSFNYPFVSDLESLYCRLMSGVKKTFVPLVEARSSDFVCQYDRHCFALCKCCDFDACDCEMLCPDECQCFHDALWSKNIAVCSASRLQDLPQQLPMDATEIYLDGNELVELGSHTFLGRKKLQKLHLNHSHITAIQNQTFNGLRSLTTLHLEGNELRQLHGFEFDTLTSLRELFLHDNLIESIEKSTFRGLRSLQVLHLHNNRLVDFPVWQLALNPLVVSLRLADNAWSCKCEFVEQFRAWINVYQNRVFDVDNIVCVNNEENEKNVIDFDLSKCDDLVYEYKSNDVDVVALDRIHAGQQRRHGRDDVSERDTAISKMSESSLRLGEDELILLMASILVLLAIVLLTLCALFVYRHSLRVWIHSKYGVRVFDNSFGQDDMSSTASGSNDAVPKLFDLFVLYSPRDESFVHQSLLQQLHVTRKPPLKALLLHRDLVHHNRHGHHGQGVSGSSVCRGSEASRRTLLVVSEHFLATEWSRPEIRSGLQQALRQRTKKLVIVVLVGPMDTRSMDPDLRLIVKTSGLVLQWGDARFWEKLNYALPDLPLEQQTAVVRGNTTMATAVRMDTAASTFMEEKLLSASGRSPMYEEHIYHQPRYVSGTLASPNSNLLLNNLLLASRSGSHPSPVYNVLDGDMVGTTKKNGPNDVVMHI